jgi:hypothetical protein
MNITHKQVVAILAVLSALGSIAIIANFFRDRRLKDELLKVNHQLKVLELEKIKASVASK